MNINCKKVALIIINYNCYIDTIGCLNSLDKIEYPRIKVFLVDNHSKNESVNILSDHFKKKAHKYEIVFTPLNKNLGFAGGNNIAIKQAYEEGFQYFWLLNNDTMVDKYALSKLVDAIERDKSIGIVGSKIYYHGTNKIWFAGGRINSWTGKTGHIGMKEDDQGQYDRMCEVDYITGCSLLFRREVLETVGYMKEDYFLYYEETEWNIRARQRGWRIVYVPTSKVYHKVSLASGGEKNPAPYVAYYDIRNAYVMIKRTQPSVKHLTAFLYMLWKIGKKVAKMMLYNQDRKIERVKAVLNGFFDGINQRMGKYP